MKEKKIRSKKFKIITNVIASVLTVGVGVGAGILTGTLSFVRKADYSQYDGNALVDNQEALMARYNKIKNTADINKYMETFESYELLNIALNKISEHQYHYLSGKGVVNAMGVHQYIRSYSIKDGDKYFSESLSRSSIVQVAKRFYQEDGYVTTYQGTLLNNEEATWNKDNHTTETVEDYESRWGKNLSTATLYIISSKTALSTSYKEIVDGKIHVSIDLEPTKSVLNYVKQMATTSDLTDYPVFNSVRFEAILDTDLTLLETDTTESYKVKKGVWAPATATLHEVHFYDDYKAFPDLDTHVLYEGSEK